MIPPDTAGMRAFRAKLRALVPDPPTCTWCGKAPAEPQRWQCASCLALPY